MSAGCRSAGITVDTADYIKDRISQAYRIYHEKGEWSYMEKESFGDLIRDYEAHGGKNSFVHDTCEPESNLWKVISRTSTDD